ncbi:MAG: hypothetical protein HZA90_14200 [Verrucomicrobia bacterium]|nr:hypothetical protein [Verrucomicrobiota bacterium]
MAIPTYDDWIKNTALGWNQPRSSRLKKVDDALKAYWKAPGHQTQKAIRMALADWIRWKGPNWKKSERNKPPRCIVEELYTNVFTGFPVAVTPEEREALRYLEEQRRLALQHLFAGKTVGLRGFNAANEGRRALMDLKRATSNIKSVVTPVSTSNESRNAITSMIGDMFDNQTVQQILPDLTTSFGGDVIASVVPVLSQLTSGAKVLIAWGKVAKAKYNQYSNSSHAYAFQAGDPAAAFTALDRMLGRDVTASAVKASISTADFTAKALLTLADGGTISGPVVGAATALANLTHKIFLFGREYQETKAANKILADPSKLDFHLFEAKPLLGCYMICCSTLSDLINMSVYEFGRPGWMDEVESLKRNHIDPVRQKADAFIRNSPYTVNGLDSFYGRGGMDKIMRGVAII